MSEQNYAAAKLDAFLEVLDDLIEETLAAGVSAAGLRQTLLARALYEFKSHPSDGIAALDHFRKALERERVPSFVQVVGSH